MFPFSQISKKNPDDLRCTRNSVSTCLSTTKIRSGTGANGVLSGTRARVLPPPKHGRDGCQFPRFSKKLPPYLTNETHLPDPAFLFIQPSPFIYISLFHFPSGRLAGRCLLLSPVNTLQSFTRGQKQWYRKALCCPAAHEFPRFAGATHSFFADCSLPFSFSLPPVSLPYIFPFLFSPEL